MGKKVTEQLLDNLLISVYIRPKEHIRIHVKSIIDDALLQGDNEHNCANEICDHLEIERRDNRNIIRKAIRPVFAG